MIDAGCDKGQFSLWNLNNEKNLWSVDKLIGGIQFSQDGSLAAGDSKLELFNLSDGSVQKYLAKPQFGGITELKYSPNGKLLFARTFAMPDMGPFWFVYTADGRTIQDEGMFASVWVFSFSGDSSLLATAVESWSTGVIRVWGVK
jgi:WD40 repeat protein